MSEKTEAKEYIAQQVFNNSNHEVTAQNVRNAFDKALNTCPSYEEGDDRYGKRTDLGNIAALKTTAKTSTVAAINELKDNSATKTELANIGSKVGGNEDNIDLAITDESNRALVEFAGGGIRTKKFDSANTPQQADANDVDFCIEDENGNRLLELKNGGIRTKNFDSTAKNDVICDDNSQADLNIIDDDGKVLGEFKDGHFKTKNFDSREAGGINFEQYKGKKLSILGDSISTYVGYIPSGNGCEYTGSNHGVTSVTQQWWHIVMTKFGMTLGIDEAWAGSGVCGTDDGVKAISTSRLSKLGNNGTPDLIILQIGTNDVAKDFGNFEFFKLTNGGTMSDYNVDKFRPAYSYIVEYLLLNYPTSRVVCMSPIYRNPYGFSNEGTTKNTYGFSMNDMADSIKKIAETYNVPFIDLSECGINVGNYRTYLQDNRTDTSYQVHPNAKGFKLMANYIIGKLQTINLLNN